jgi:hypothetical protein
MTEQFKSFISSKCPGAEPLLIVIRGSQAYGTNLPTSDTDYSGIYIQSAEDILGFRYKEQINDDKNDTVFYEIRRFLDLLSSNNPTVLELLNTPEDCILFKHPLMDKILQNRDKFITKTCGKSFAGYAIQQIKKARGQDKKQNWEKDKVTRKDVLDFVYVIEGEKSIPWKVWNSDKRFEEKFCGVINVPNARDIYAVYYDQHSEECFSERFNEQEREENKLYHKEKYGHYGLGYKGIIKIEEGDNISESNQLRLSSVPKDQIPICVVTYNKDAYTQHCKDYKSYQTWLQERNEQRWIEVESHGQKIDGKNMMHCRRLLDMSREIAQGKGIIVRRENAQELIDIRKGKVDPESLLDRAEQDIKEIDDLFKNSELPDFVDKDFMNSLLISIRKEFYSIL